MVKSHRRRSETRRTLRFLWATLGGATAVGVLLPVFLVDTESGTIPFCAAVAAGAAAGLCAPRPTRSGRRLATHARAGWWAVTVALALLSLSGTLRGLDLVFDLTLPGSGAAQTAAAVAGIVAVSLLFRDRIAGSLTLMRLDAVIVGLAVASFVAALVLGPVLAMGDLPPGAATIALLGPVVSLLLVAAVAGSFGVLGLSGGRDLGLVMLGALVTVTMSWVQLRLPVSQSGGTVGVLALGGVVLVAAGSVYRGRRIDPVTAGEGWNALVLPGVFTVGSLLLLGAALAEDSPITTGALALCAVAAGVGRAALALRDLRDMTLHQDRAHADELTGLPNRRAFLQKLEQAVADVGPEGELGLFVLDLHRFKVVNEALGTAVGNEILRQAAERLSALLEGSVPLGRLGGDEFGVVLAGGGGGEEALDAAALLSGVFAAPFRVGETSIRVDVRVGVALRPIHADDASGLLRRAEVAVQQARSADDRVAVYEPSLDSRHGDRMVTVERLRDAVTRGELLVHYQPQINLRTGDVVGVEALVRWHHPERGVLRPDSFLTLVEQAGLMRELTEVVLSVAVRSCRRLWDSGRAINVSVNLAAANVLDAALPDHITRLLGRKGLPSSALRLEVTEESMMADPARATAIFERLRAVGIAVTIDDFGGGNSSLSYLRRIPTDALKLDRALVAHTATDETAAAVVRCLADLAHALGLTLAASGVEDLAILDQLTAAGVDIVQGYQLAAPMPANELVRWLDAYGSTVGSVRDRLALHGRPAHERPAGMLDQVRTPGAHRRLTAGAPTR